MNKADRQTRLKHNTHRTVSLFQTQPENSFQFTHYLINIRIGINKLQCPRLYLWHIQNIINQLQQHIRITFDYLNIRITFGFGSIGQQSRETNYRIQRSPNFMAHISQESCLLFTCHFRHPPGHLQFFLYLLQTRNISHGQQHLFISVLHHICPRNTHHTIHVVISVIRQIKPHRSF